MLKVDRHILHDRHRLSHHQIDRIVGEDSGNKFLNEKLRQLACLKQFLQVTDLLKKTVLILFV